MWTPAERVESHVGRAGDQDLSGNAQLGLGIALATTIQLDDAWSPFGLATSNGAEREADVNARQNRGWHRLMLCYRSPGAQIVAFRRDGYKGSAPKTSQARSQTSAEPEHRRGAEEGKGAGNLIDADIIEKGSIVIKIRVIEGKGIRACNSRGEGKLIGIKIHKWLN